MIQQAEEEKDEKIVDGVKQQLVTEPTSKLEDNFCELEEIVDEEDDQENEKTISKNEDEINDEKNKEKEKEEEKEKIKKIEKKNKNKKDEKKKNNIIIIKISFSKMKHKNQSDVFSLAFLILN